MRIKFEKKKKPRIPVLEESITGMKGVLEKDMKDDKLYYEARPFEVKYNLSKKQIRKEQKLFRKNLGSLVLIKMEMSSGQFREFLVPSYLDYFKYKTGLYVFDPSMKYYIIERDIWAFDFHELISIPLRKNFNISENLEKELQPEVDKSMRMPLKPNIDVNEIKTLIENSKLVDVEESINPMTLKRMTDSEVIKQVLQGAMLSRIFKIMFILIIIIAIFMVLLLVIQLYTSGIIGMVMDKFGGG